MVVKPASVNCDGECRPVSGDEKHNAASHTRLDHNTERHEQVEMELPEMQTSVHGGSILRLKDQNAAAPINDSNSPLILDVENELKYDQDTPAGNVFRNDDDEDDDDDDDQMGDGERGKGTETGDEEEGEKKEDHDKQGQKDDEKQENEVEDDEVVENVDFDRNKFIIPAPNHPASDNVTRTSVESDMVEDNLLDLPEDSEIADNSLPVLSATTATNSIATGAQAVDFDRNKFIVPAPDHPATDNVTRPSAESDVVEDYLPEDTEIADNSFLSPSTTTTVNSTVTVAQADVVENVDFDRNKFIVPTPNHPVSDNATRTSVESDVVEENLLDLPEDTEIADNSVPILLDNNEVNNVIRLHTDDAGK